jgi:hypothetical protein
VCGLPARPFPPPLAFFATGRQLPNEGMPAAALVPVAPLPRAHLMLILSGGRKSPADLSGPAAQHGFFQGDEITPCSQNKWNFLRS